MMQKRQQNPLKSGPGGSQMEVKISPWEVKQGTKISSWPPGLPRDAPAPSLAIMAPLGAQDKHWNRVGPTGTYLQNKLWLAYYSVVDENDYQETCLF